MAARAQQVEARAYELDQQSKHSDQFIKAVQMMTDASSTPDGRAGGIYSLEQLGLASSDNRGPIVETLTAYIRTHSKRPASAPTSPPDQPTTDIQAAISVLARNSWASRAQALDLTGVDLRAADLRRAKLQRATLIRALFADADLTGADLTGANLAGADFRGRTKLTQTTMKDAILVGAHMESIDASGLSGLDVDQLAAVSTSPQTILPSYVQQPTPPPPPPPGESVTISTPSAGGEVSITPEIAGSWMGIDTDTTLWMITQFAVDQNTALSYPQGVSFPNYRNGLNRQSDGSWCTERGYVGAGADTGKEFTILVVGVNKSADDFFRKYLELGPRIGFPALRYLPSGTTVYASVAVKRSSTNLSAAAQYEAEQEQAAACPHS